jgi:hypothetical protein
MSATFISFPAAAGGNHLRNIITLATDFLPDSPYKQSMEQEYSQNGRMFVHGADLTPERMNNLNSFKLHQAAMEPSANLILYGHFGEVMSFRNDIKKMHDKKFILISFETQKCKDIWIKRSRKLNMGVVDDAYYLGEQHFLYEAFMYYDVFRVKPCNVMNIGIYEWFAHDISNVMERIEAFLPCKVDYEKCKKLHEIWLSKNLDVI